MIHSEDSLFRLIDMIYEAAMDECKWPSLEEFASVVDTGSLLFASQRDKCAGAFGEEEMRLMGMLAPHVIRAVQVHRRISRVTIEKEWAFGVLDYLHLGVILTNNVAVPLFVNRAAERMLTQQQGITVYHGKLVLSTSPQTTLFHKFIADAANGVPDAAIGGDMRITRPGNGGCLHCMVIPVSLELSARLNFSPASGCVAVFISKPGNLQLPPKRLAVLYGLTPAEARLAAKLATFRSMEQAADDLCISVNTARTQLKSVFSKTGAKSQSELLVLLATGTLAHCHNLFVDGTGI